MLKRIKRAIPEKYRRLIKRFMPWRYYHTCMVNNVRYGYPEAHATDEYEGLVFLHIPKTAGSRVREVIQAHVPDEQIHLIGLGFDLMYVSDRQLADHAVLMGHFGQALLKRVIRPSVHFTFLRHPVDRVISTYYYWRSLPDHPNPQSGIMLAKSMELDEFVESQEHAIKSDLDNLQMWTMFGGPEMIIRDRNEHLSDAQRLKQAKENLAAMHFVGIQDDFQTHINHFEALVGWEKSEPKITNKTEGGKRNVPDHILKKLEKRQSLDCELYEYAIELTNKHAQDIKNGKRLKLTLPKHPTPGERAA
ncbi:MAG: sulfotransferase family protein [Rickettsiales bacterium]|nr:sulfotransferase family protein [Rickettsiales bacterium]